MAYETKIKNKKYWENSAFSNSHGQFHSYLGIPKNEKISRQTLFQIHNAKEGSEIKINQSGKKVRVTEHHKRQAQLLINSEGY